MKHSLIAAAAAVVAGHAFAAPLQAGDIAIYRVGTGSAGLSSAATQVFIDEYTPTGSLVQSIAMPTLTSGANGMLTASGTATSEGELTLSADGRFLVATGYNAALGTAGVAGTTGSAVNRTVGLLNVQDGSINTTTLLSDFSSGNNPRSAVSTNGTDLWVAGAAGGVRYTTLGSGTSTQLSTTVTNLRQLESFGGQLYTSDSSGSAVRLGAVGSGMPTAAGQTIVNLPGISASTGSPYAFFMADLSTTVAGLDTLYVADDAAGLTKYSLVGGTWLSNGTLGAGADAYRGLAATVSGGSVNLFATRKGGSTATGGGELVSLVDTSGYNGSFSASITTLATASTNEAFRGLAIVPVPEPESYALVLAGLGVVGMIGRRRNRR